MIDDYLGHSSKKPVKTLYNHRDFSFPVHLELSELSSKSPLGTHTSRDKNFYKEFFDVFFQYTKERVKRSKNNENFH